MKVASKENLMIKLKRKELNELIHLLELIVDVNKKITFSDKSQAARIIHDLNDETPF